jgi:hypothetical protein
MSVVSIPKWSAEGVIPPIDVASPTSVSRSPYRVPLADFVLRFAMSDKRRAILDGLLRYRAALHAVGLTSGFQWVNGSFLENVEVIESRDPQDVDVVTFYHLPSGVTQRAVHESNPSLFDHDGAKAAYQVDAYPVCLDRPPEFLVERSAYWYSVWSHRRNQAWKGYVQITLDHSDDGTAAALLAASGGTGANP